MPYNRYRGNTGRVERVEDRPPPIEAEPLPQPERPPEPMPERRPPPPPLPQPELLSGGLSRLMRRLSPAGLETEDILLLMILYLLYRESGDRDFLIMMGGILFF